MSSRSIFRSYGVTAWTENRSRQHCRLRNLAISQQYTGHFGTPGERWAIGMRISCRSCIKIRNTCADLVRSLLPPACRIYTSAGAGYDWVDAKTLAQNGIIYCNSAAACTESVADSAIYLILSAFRRFSWSSLCARSLDPDKFLDAHRNIAATTHNPNGHVLGIIGLGKIGYRIAEKAHQSFGMNIMYHDIVRMSQAIEESVGAEFVADLHELLSKSDCSLLATSYSGKILLQREHFASMKQGSRFINIARGKLVDEEALITALQSEHLFAAGLDVHFNEPHVDPRLAKMSNVELQCHTAGASVASHIGFERLGMENILSWLKTGEAINPVNLNWLDKSKI
jgi:lactate dehydrogenase-like 2-hydroxyacid dehydrogenase